MEFFFVIVNFFTQHGIVCLLHFAYAMPENPSFLKHYFWQIAREKNFNDFSTMQKKPLKQASRDAFFVHSIQSQNYFIDSTLIKPKFYRQYFDLTHDFGNFQNV